MTRGRAVADRVGLAVTGTALCLLGGGALLRGAGVFGPGAAARPVVGGDVAEFARDRLWFWPSLAAGGFLLAAAGLCWLVSRLRPDQVRRLRLRAGAGLVEVAGAPLGRVVAAQVGAHPRIRRARAVVRGSARRPWLDLRVRASGGAPVGEVLSLVGGRALPGLRAALALERLPAVVRLTAARDARAGLAALGWPRAWDRSHDHAAASPGHARVS